MTLLRNIVLTFAALALTGAGQAALAAVETATPRIVGGEAVQGCGWPSVVSLGGCSGVLVHPQVVLTAAHCAPQMVHPLVRFDPKTPDGDPRYVATRTCHAYPGFHGNFGDGVDWAYCVLDKPIRDVPIVPVMTQCEYSEWTRYALYDHTVMVGFGLDELGRSGTKRAVRVPVRELLGQEIRVGGDGRSGCNGDSGGPAFVQLPDKTWRVMGIISYARGACGTAEFLSSVPDSLAWLGPALAEEGLDITPCTDAQGVWVGGPYCADFPTDPGQPQCQLEPAVGGATQSCTSAFGTEIREPGLGDRPMLAPKHLGPQTQNSAALKPAQAPPAAPAQESADKEPEGFSLGCSLGGQAPTRWALWLLVLGLSPTRRKL